jgi:hypothetical protein
LGNGAVWFNVAGTGARGDANGVVVDDDVVLADHAFLAEDAFLDRAGEAAHVVTNLSWRSTEMAETGITRRMYQAVWWKAKPPIVA